MKIVTNHYWRNFLDFSDLTEKEKKDYDDIEDKDTKSYLRYKGIVFRLEDFEYNNSIEGWDGTYHSTVWSGVVIKISEDSERYKIGTYLE